HGHHAAGWRQPPPGALSVDDRALLQKDIAVVMCQKLTLRAMWARPSRKDLVMLRLAVMLRLRSVWPEAPRDKGLSTARAEQIEEPAPLTPH
ncbi:manF, partial [Symbiodinium microadriaticum]